MGAKINPNDDRHRELWEKMTEETSSLSVIPDYESSESIFEYDAIISADSLFASELLLNRDYYNLYALDSDLESIKLFMLFELSNLIDSIILYEKIYVQASREVLAFFHGRNGITNILIEEGVLVPVFHLSNDIIQDKSSIRIFGDIIREHHQEYIDIDPFSFAIQKLPVPWDFPAWIQAAEHVLNREHTYLWNIGNWEFGFRWPEAALTSAAAIHMAGGDKGCNTSVSLFQYPFSSQFPDIGNLKYLSHLYKSQYKKSVGEAYKKQGYTAIRLPPFASYVLTNDKQDLRKALVDLRNKTQWLREKLRSSVFIEAQGDNPEEADRIANRIDMLFSNFRANGNLFMKIINLAISKRFEIEVNAFKGSFTIPPGCMSSIIADSIHIISDHIKCKFFHECANNLMHLPTRIPNLNMSISKTELAKYYHAVTEYNAAVKMHKVFCEECNARQK